VKKKIRHALLAMDSNKSSLPAFQVSIQWIRFGRKDLGQFF
jgi:hypothetical protein